MTSGALMLGEAAGLPPHPGPRAWWRMATRTMASIRLPQVHHTGQPVSTWAWALLTPTFLAAGGPALTSASSRAGSLPGALTHTNSISAGMGVAA